MGLPKRRQIKRDEFFFSRKKNAPSYLCGLEVALLYFEGKKYTPMGVT
jgi:hypothetical protein